MTSSLRKPTFVLPHGTCDTHCHIWGPIDRFPFAQDRPYTPPERDKTVLADLYRRLGIERSVFVQPIVYGTDNRAMLDAIRDDPRRFRGIALVDSDIDENELRQLHEGGVRGVRFGFVKHLRARPDLAKFRRTLERIAPFGWHVLLHLDASDLIELKDVIDALRIPFIIDHMGRVDAAGGVDQPAFRQLLALAGNDRCWIKVSGADRVSATGTPFRDVVPFARALLAAAPDRVLWGTDFPHPNPRHPVADDADLVDLLPEFGDQQALTRLLVGNPARLYGFDGT
jgi:predicted TIM-barrel fold metal-dependent hydrolase